MSSKKILFISDGDTQKDIGGAELNDKELLNVLADGGFSVKAIKSSDLDIELLNTNRESFIILSNFLEVRADCLKAIKARDYLIYEHDHKYIASRDPGVFPDFKAPIEHKRFIELYKRAKAVLCQSALHCEIISSNLNISNVINLGGNLWSNEMLEWFSSMIGSPKKDRASILRSPVWHKNTIGAIKYCVKNKMAHELIDSNIYQKFLEQLSQNDKFIFLPHTPETLSRLVVEALMMDISVHCHDRIGASSEPWFNLKGVELIAEMKKKRSEILGVITKVISGSYCAQSRSRHQIPLISIITSLYDGDDQIDGFLKDITSQTIFDNCELIIVDGNSPGNEARSIRRYQEKFSNITYLKLDEDPGIYGCWNKAISLSSGGFISNANLDDRRSHQHLEILGQHLADNPHIDLVYSEFYVTHSPNEDFLENSSNFHTYPGLPFSQSNMRHCLPGCMPVWRKSMHDRYGLFDSSLKFAGDWEMWLRAAAKGSVFLQKPGVYGLYYHNPKGLTTSKSLESSKVAEELKVREQYSPYING